MRARRRKGPRLLLKERRAALIAAAVTGQIGLGRVRYESHLASSWPTSASIETAEFRFQPGFNLIVGVNGVGKSTVLDALCICISRILPSTTESRSKARSFSISDIRNGFPFLDAELSLAIGVDEFRFTRRQWRETFAADDDENIEKLRREILDSERLRDRARNLLRELEESHGVSDSDAFAPSKAELKSAAHTAADDRLRYSIRPIVPCRPSERPGSVSLRGVWMPRSWMP